MAPPFEQTIFTQTQGLFVCNILEFCWVLLKKKIFKGVLNRTQIFAFFHFQSSAKMWSFTVILKNYVGLGLWFLLVQYKAPSTGGSEKKWKIYMKNMVFEP